MSTEQSTHDPPTLERHGEVYVLDLGDGENRFNEDWLGAVEAHLDEVRAAPAPRALVTKARGRFWSNGLDLEWMAANQDRLGEFVPRVHELLARVLALDVPNVAALQGHTFAAGAMLALAHDQRVMRADRGYFCLPEVDIGIPFTVGMTALISARLPVATAHEAMTTGRRYGGEEAAAAGVVDEAV
ncbi:MAG TPA: enoyl-CoA hydratase-related protein, partial [Solirubrobacteraceae bacterium]|nr:enoyl-CoA hydratase-related protein [Solirubrobacteraceae bacterium]